MNYPHAFIDVDCLELSPNGKTFVCHPQVEPISQKLFELYGAISEIVNPILFTIDINSQFPETIRRHDFTTIPCDSSNSSWKESAAIKFKFYLEKTASSPNESEALFDRNDNALELIRLVKAKEWIIFGKGLKDSIDHIICTLLEKKHTVKYIPELIIPEVNENEEQLADYFEKWDSLGAEAISYVKVMNFNRLKKPKKISRY